MTNLLRPLLWHDEGQDIAEYAVMLAVILVIVVGTTVISLSYRFLIQFSTN